MPVLLVYRAVWYVMNTLTVMYCRYVHVTFLTTSTSLQTLIMLQQQLAGDASMNISMVQGKAANDSQPTHVHRVPYRSYCTFHLQRAVHWAMQRTEIYYYTTSRVVSTESQEKHIWVATTGTY